MMKPVSRALSFGWIAVVYALALAAAMLVFNRIGGGHPLLAMMIADCAATLVVWLAGVAAGNASVYDPYWSVAPVAIAACWAFELRPARLASALFLVVLLVWGIRLTANWAKRWGGLAHQDWRYTMYRQRMPRLWFFVNLFGINLMPTALVYLALAPVYFGMSTAAPVNAVTLCGFLLAAAAVWMEHTADRQMNLYRRQPNGPCMANGLWRMCRHPNYLGEILFWWGLWVMQISLSPVLWTVIGPLFITLLFVFVSIPMMEKHLLHARPEYAGVMAEVPMLLPPPSKLPGLLARVHKPEKQA